MYRSRRMRQDAALPAFTLYEVSESQTPVGNADAGSCSASLHLQIRPLSSSAFNLRPIACLYAHRQPHRPIRPSSFKPFQTNSPLTLTSLEAFPIRRGRGALAHTPLIPAPLLQPLPRRHIQVPIQLSARLLTMYEVAEAAPHAAFARVEAAAGFPEVRDGRELAVDGAAGVPARVECVAGLLRVFFVLEADVDVADEV